MQLQFYKTRRGVLFGKAPGGWDSWGSWDGWDSLDQQINRQLQAQSGKIVCLNF